MHVNTNQQYSATDLSRDFKGIWIPREIWLNEDLAPLEKLVWAEIHSLFDRRRGGCYASNFYLGKFFRVGETYISKIITKLKLLGFIEEVTFNGRTRVIRAILPPEDFGQCKADLHYSARQTNPTEQGSLSQECNPPIYIENKEKGIDYPPNPQGGKPTNVGVGKVQSSSQKKPKKKPKGSDATDILKDTYHENVLLSKDEYAKLLAAHGEKALLWMIEVLSAYIGSSGRAYKSHYHLMTNGGWVCKRLKEEETKNPHLQPTSGYKRYGKLAIEADKRAEATERQQLSTDNVNDAEFEAVMAKMKAKEGKK
jgi:hypothetical protein